MRMPSIGGRRGRRAPGVTPARAGTRCPTWRLTPNWQAAELRFADVSDSPAGMVSRELLACSLTQRGVRTHTTLSPGHGLLAAPQVKKTDFVTWFLQSPYADAKLKVQPAGADLRGVPRRV